MDPQAFSYTNIRDLQDSYRKKGSPLGQVDTPTFAKLMQLTDRQGNDFTQGVNDNIFKRASTNIQRGIDYTGAPMAAGAAIGGIGAGVDYLRGADDQKYEKLGNDTGRAIPRGIMDTAAVVGGGVLTATGVGSVVGIPLMAAGMADAGLTGYTDTDSVGAGLVQAALTGLAPGIGKVGNALGTSVLGKISAKAALSPVANVIASEVGQEAAFFTADAAGQLVQGQNPFTPENIFANAAGTLAFSPVLGVEGVKAYRNTPKAIPGEPLSQAMTVFGNPMRAGKDKSVDVDQGITHESKLFDYLAGATTDASIRTQMEKGDLRSALESTGMIDQDLTNVSPEVFNRRAKGRELAQRAEQGDINSEEGQRLLRKSSALLQIPQTRLTDIVKRVSAINAFETKFKNSQPFQPAGLLTNRPQMGDSVDDSRFVPQEKQFGGYIEDVRMENYPDEVRSGFDSLQNRRRLEDRETMRYGQGTEDQGRLGQIADGMPVDYEAPQGRRPEAVKGKTSDLGANLKAPAFSKVGDVNLSARPKEEVFTQARTKAVQEGYKPDVFFHGAAEGGHKEFDTTKNGYNFGPGTYFTPQHSRAKRYAGEKNDYRGRIPAPEGSEVYKVFLKYDKPYEVRSDAEISDLGYKLSKDNKPLYDQLAQQISNERGYGDPRAASTTEIGNAYLRSQGYDAIVKSWGKGDTQEVVVFSPNQIKRVNSNVPLEQRFDKSKNNIDYSLVNLTDSSGKITGESVRAQYERLLKLESDPDSALIRLDQQIRGALTNKVKATAPDVFIGDGLDVASRAFDSLGISREMKQDYLGATHRLLERASVFETSRIRNIDDLVKSGQITQAEANGAYGVFVHSTNEIGINTRQQFSSPELGAFYTASTIAHEVMHNTMAKADTDLIYGIDNKRIKAIRDVREMATSLDEVSRRELLQTLHTGLIPKEILSKDQESRNRVLSSINTAARDPEEFIVSYGSMLAMSLVSNDPKVGGVQKVREHLRWAPQPIQDFAQAIFRGMSELRQMTKAVAQSLGVNVGKLDTFESNLLKILEPDDEIVQARNRIARTVQAHAILHENAGQAGIQYSKVGVAAMDDRATEIGKANLFERTIGVLHQTVNSMKYKESIPEASQALAALTSLGGRIKSTLNAIRGDYLVRIDGGILQELSQVSNASLSPAQVMRKSRLQRVADSEPLQTKLSEIMRKTNDEVSNNEPSVGFDSPNVAKLWEGLPAEDVAAMRAMYDGQLASNRTASDMIRAKTVNRITYDTFEVYRSAGLNHKEAEATGRVLMNHLVEGRILPPELLKIAGTENAVRYWEAVKPGYEELSSTLDRPFFSELRTGRYQVVYSRGEGQDNGRIAANSLNERKALIKELEKNGHQIVEIKDNQNREFSEFDEVPTYVAERMLRLEQSRYDAAIDRLDPSAADAIRGEYTFGQGIKEEIDLRKQFLAKRTYAPGREYINMVNNQAAYAEVVAASVTKAMQRDQVKWLMQSENWSKDAKLKNEVEEFAHEIFTGSTQSGALRTFKKTVIGSAMGFNVSTALIDSSQGLMVALWKVAESTGIQKASKYISQGYVEAFRPTPKDKGFADILIRAHDDEYLQTGYAMNEVLDLNDVAGYNVVRAGDRRNLVNLEGALTSHEYMAGKVMDMVKQLGGKAFQGIMIPTKISSQINNKVALFAGYKAGMDKGLKGDDLYQYAVNTMQVTNFQGGRAASSTFKTKAKHFNGILEASTLLTNYPIAVISQMTGSYKSALKSSGLSPTARARAAQVFTGQLLTQFAFAGSLGLGLDALFKLSSEFFNVDPEAEIREGLAGIDESGTLADVILHGVMNKITGIDVASRYSLSGIGGFNGYTGFDAKGLFGAGGSFFANITQAPQQVLDGDITKIGVVPSGLRKMIHSAQGEVHKDKSGQALMEPTETERFVEFLGFRPERLSQIQNQRSLYKTAEAITERENTLKTNDRITKLTSGKFSEVLTELKGELSENIEDWTAQGISPQDIATLKAQALRQSVMSLVNKTVQKTLPIDPLSEGSAASASRRSRIAETFGSRLTPRAIEQQQQQLAAGLLQGLGQSAIRRSPRSIQVSQLAGQLIQANPTMSEQEAKLLAESQLGQ